MSEKNSDVGETADELLEAVFAELPGRGSGPAHPTQQNKIRQANMPKTGGKILPAESMASDCGVGLDMQFGMLDLLSG